jgi:Transglutaminase-like superfamily
MVFSHVWIAVRLALCLCLLPWRLGVSALPALLARPMAVRRTGGTPMPMDHAVQMVMRICRLWPFDLPTFPQSRLRRALALHYVLARLGYSVEIHFGIHKAKDGVFHTPHAPMPTLALAARALAA